ncbi:hypothetical protein, partial [Hyalangium sp.]|uniref:hypothetical protein n=1 Tax=Hyalangium sp. TaxID=2028555 RepID=UPI002D486152
STVPTPRSGALEGSGRGVHFVFSTQMRMASLPQRVMALSLVLLLVACGATRSAYGPQEGDELSRLVLVIQEAPDARVTHGWEPVSHFDLSKYPSRVIDGGLQGRFIRAAWTRDCEEEFDACTAMRVKSLTGPNWSHANQGSKARICRDRCRPAYNDCSRLRDQAEALSFPVIDEAVDWLKRHRRELRVGAVVVIAGVAFVAIVAGSGGSALILAPAVLFVSADASPTPSIAAAKP